MHELALAQSLLDIIVKTATEHGSPRVESATLRLGNLTHVDPDALAFAVSIAAQGTCAEGIVLHIRRVPLVARCSGCGFSGEVPPMNTQCPKCGNVGLSVMSGREIELESIEVEEEQPCTKSP